MNFLSSSSSGSLCNHHTESVRVLCLRAVCLGCDLRAAPPTQEIKSNEPKRSRMPGRPAPPPRLPLRCRMLKEPFFPAVRLSTAAAFTYRLFSLVEKSERRRRRRFQPFRLQSYLTRWHQRKVSSESESCGMKKAAEVISSR